MIHGSDYGAFVTGLKARVEAARLSAARSVNRDLILLYWDIGQGIVGKQRALGWGKAVVETVAQDLRDSFPEMRGFSANNIWLMRQFYSEYSEPSFLAQLVQETGGRSRLMPRLPVAEMPAPAAARHHRTRILEQLVQELLPAVPWGHHVEILKKVKPPAARFYYLRATARFGWSRRVLLNQIKAGAYERSRRDGKAHNFPAALPEHLAEQAEEALKSSYNLEFLGLGRAVQERELEDRLVRSLRDFILELGYGFCFVGRQHRLALGSKEYFVDLLFYHRFLKALVAIDLKIGEFEPEFAGKMDFYLNLLNDKERAPDDRPSLGIILCAEKDNLEVEYALKTKANPIGVAEYRLQPRLPASLKGKLPTAQQLATALRLPSPR
ncbi:PDDEXK nuclease domain-containing protein [Paracoccus sp. (in: a-proteobacteria)]|uniref:PDDEXK nuclease domain-containing protein n=1 Tax=Paracoccus sp. TaxID=267 RepID=UPI00321F7D26